MGQFPFGERPDSFIGIEFRGVSGKVLDVESGVLPEEVAERLPLVSRGIIQQRDDGTPQMPQQFPQESTDLLLPDVVKVEQIIEAQLMPLGAQRNSGNDGDLVPPPLAMPMDRGLALRSPGLDHVGNQQKARFIGEDYMGAQPRSVCFIRGQSFCFQPSMAFSFRSSARRSGFCALHCKLCINRPTWSR